MIDESALRFLIVDDDEAFRNRLIRALRDRGFEAEGAAGYDEAMTAAADFRPERAVVDLRIPGRSGLDVLRELKAALPDIRCLVLTGYGSIATATAAVRLGAVDYLTKPADTDQILTVFGDGGSGETEPAPPDTVPSLERVEWEHIQRVLQDCSGNITHAAKALNIHRRTLQRKLANFPPLR